MIEALIFDIGNVLLRFDFNRALERIRDHCAKPLETAALEPLKGRYEEGALTREQFETALVELLGYTGVLPDLTAAWQEIFTENKLMTDLVREWHGRYPLYLLSNTSDLHIDYIFKTYPVFSLFDDALYSFTARRSKPHPEIFEAAIRKFGVAPFRTVYVDDLAQNVEAAAAAGLRALQYDPDEHALFEEQLRALGLSFQGCAN